MEDYSYMPRNFVEIAAYRHDLRYNKLGISGLNGLFNDKRAIGADWNFVGENLAAAINPTVGPINQGKAYLIGIGLGLIALPKTIEYYMPTLVRPYSN